MTPLDRGTQRLLPCRSGTQTGNGERQRVVEAGRDLRQGQHAQSGRESDAVALLVLEAIDPDGRAFLRVSAAGVLGDIAAPYFHATANPPDVPPRPPPFAVPGSKPRWIQIGVAHSWGWFEPRLHPFEPGREPAPGPADSTAATTISRWAVPLRYDGAAVEVRGSLARLAVTGQFVAEARDLPEGLGLQIVNGRVPALFLRVPTGRNVVVAGADGLAFLRMNDRGAFANPRSVTFRENPDFATKPTTADGWVRVAGPGAARWLDTRLRYPADRPPRDIAQAERKVDLARWAVPLALDGGRVELQGTIAWVPARMARVGTGERGLAGLLPWVAGAVVLIAFAGASVPIRTCFGGRRGCR